MERKLDTKIPRPTSIHSSGKSGTPTKSVTESLSHADGKAKESIKFEDEVQSVTNGNAYTKTNTTTVAAKTFQIEDRNSRSFEDAAEIVAIKTTNDVLQSKDIDAKNNASSKIPVLVTMKSNISGSETDQVLSDSNSKVNSNSIDTADDKHSESFSQTVVNDKLNLKPSQIPIPVNKNKNGTDTRIVPSEVLEQNFGYEGDEKETDGDASYVPPDIHVQTGRRISKTSDSESNAPSLFDDINNRSFFSKPSQIPRPFARNGCIEDEVKIHVDGCESLDHLDKLTELADSQTALHHYASSRIPVPVPSDSLNDIKHASNTDLREPNQETSRKEDSRGNPKHTTDDEKSHTASENPCFIPRLVRSYNQNQDTSVVFNEDMIQSNNSENLLNNEEHFGRLTGVENADVNADVNFDKKNESMKNLKSSHIPKLITGDKYSKGVDDCFPEDIDLEEYSHDIDLHNKAILGNKYAKSFNHSTTSLQYEAVCGTSQKIESTEDGCIEKQTEPIDTKELECRDNICTHVDLTEVKQILAETVVARNVEMIVKHQNVLNQISMVNDSDQAERQTGEFSQVAESKIATDCLTSVDMIPSHVQKNGSTEKSATERNANQSALRQEQNINDENDVGDRSKLNQESAKLIKGQIKPTKQIQKEILSTNVETPTTDHDKEVIQKGSRLPLRIRAFSHDSNRHSQEENRACSPKVKSTVGIFDKKRQIKTIPTEKSSIKHQTNHEQETKAETNIKTTLQRGDKKDPKNSNAHCHTKREYLLYAIPVCLGVGVVGVWALFRFR